MNYWRMIIKAGAGDASAWRVCRQRGIAAIGSPILAGTGIRNN